MSDLLVTPDEARPSQEVTISAVITNIGGSEGSYTTVLKINNVEEGNKEVIIGVGKSETVTFTTTKDMEGSYTVNINGKVGQFNVIVSPTVTTAPIATQPFQPQTNWWLIFGIIAGCVIAGFPIYYLVSLKVRTFSLNRYKAKLKRWEYEGYNVAELRDKWFRTKEAPNKQYEKTKFL